MPTVSVDSRGRIYLPKKIRENSGKKFRVVKLESGIKLIPVNEDPIEGLKQAANHGEGVDIESISDEVEKEAKKELEEEF
jgi:bifunctional DNA-binding transcriptional regulator/antitoxin component of YhaV-PrlF toxin-antitoxin module